MITALVLGFVVCGWRLSIDVPDPDMNTLMRDALLDALSDAHLTQKDAYMSMGYSKSHWSEICAGTKSLPSTNRMLRLPARFWFAYWPRVIYVVGRKQALEVREDFRLKRGA